MFDERAFCLCRGTNMDFCVRTIYKRSGSTHSGVPTVEKPCVKRSPRPALFEREVLAHHVTRELFGSRAEGVNAVAAEQVDHLLLL